MKSQKTAPRRLFTPRTFTARTKQRFALDRRKRLVNHLGGSASDVQRLLIERVIDVEWSLMRLSARADDAPLSPHAAREYLALDNHLRLLTRELGLKGQSPPPRTLDDIGAEIGSAA